MSGATLSDPQSIYHWQRLDERVTSSGQPSEAELVALRDLGVRHIINLGLHSHEKALADEAASVAALGMTYNHIPVEFGSPTEQDFDRFRRVFESLPDDPVHVHCIANYRVSAFFYRYRRDVLGMNEEQARAEMHKIWRPDAIWARFVGLKAGDR